MHCCNLYGATSRCSFASGVSALFLFFIEKGPKMAVFDQSRGLGVGPSWLVVQFWCSWVCEVLVEPRVPRVCGRFCLTAVAQWTAPRTPRRPTSHARHPARGLQALLQRGPQIFASGPRNFSRAPKKFSQRPLEFFAEDPPKNCPPGRIVGKSYYKMCPFCPKSCVPKGYKLPPKKLPRAQYFLPGGPI